MNQETTIAPAAEMATMRSTKRSVRTGLRP